MKGGPRARAGPPPDPDSLTQTEGEWTVLPLEGRDGPLPGWPLSEPADEWELVFWERQWRRPQAIMWERAGQAEEVALYCRALAAAQKEDAATPSRVLVRQIMESLGISMPGMLRNRWRIGPKMPVAPGGEGELEQDDDLRSRLTVVSRGVA